MSTPLRSSATQVFLGIEGGGTRSTVLLEDAQGREIHSFTSIPAVLPLMSDRELQWFLRDIKSRLPMQPDAIGIGLAGVRGKAEADRVRRAVSRIWPRTACVATNDLETALAAAPLPDEKSTHILVLSGTGSCCFGRSPQGKTAKIGGRGHVIGDRGSSCDIGLRALRRIIADLDHRGRMSALGSALLAALMFNEAEQLIPWSVSASKNEIASLAITVFRMAEKGNAMAKSLLAETAQMLAEDACACAESLRASGKELEFVFNGAVLLKNPKFLRQVIRKIRVHFPDAKMTPLTQGSVHGAVVLAKANFNNSLKKPPHLDHSNAGDLSLPKPLLDLSILKASPTEQRNSNSMTLDQLSPLEGVDLMLKEDRVILPALAKHREAIAQAVSAVAKAFQNEGHLFYVGAGTSGRLGVLDASEIPPTFSAPREQVQGIIAGGRPALWSAVEGAEDDLSAGIRTIAERGIHQRDVVIGIAASGRTPFVWGALHEANRRGAFTILLCFNPAIQKALTDISHALWKPTLTLAIDVGPELLTGSTRLKSGTATKLTLNMITTLAMVQCGKVISNLMVDLNPSNVKLRDRAARMLIELTQCTHEQAKAALKETGWIVQDAFHLLESQMK